MVDYVTLEAPLRKLLNSLWRSYQDFYGRNYSRGMRNGLWRAELLQAAAPRAGERVLEVSAKGFSVSSQLGEKYTSVDVYATQPDCAYARKSEPMSPGNAEYVDCQNYQIKAQALFFDKIVCSFALHPLSPGDKLTLLTDMRRVLRHGGTLHLAELDKPEMPQEMTVLQATSYYFGAESAQPHLDGSWIAFIKQAGFVGVRMSKGFSEAGARVALIRARRA